MEKFQINDAEVKRIYESKVQELKQLTAAPVDSKDYLWDEGVGASPFRSPATYRQPPASHKSEV